MLTPEGSFPGGRLPFVYLERRDAARSRPSEDDADADGRGLAGAGWGGGRTTFAENVPGGKVPHVEGENHPCQTRR